MKTKRMLTIPTTGVPATTIHPGVFMPWHTFQNADKTPVSACDGCWTMVTDVFYWADGKHMTVVVHTPHPTDNTRRHVHTIPVDSNVWIAHRRDTFDGWTTDA